MTAAALRVQHGDGRDRRADSDLSLRGRAVRTRALMRQSLAWRRAVAVISSLSLLYGYERPQQAAVRFAVQTVADALAPLDRPASEAADLVQIQQHIDEALLGRTLSSSCSSSCRRTRAWRARGWPRIACA